MKENEPDRRYDMPESGVNLEGKGYSTFPARLSEENYVSMRMGLRRFCVGVIDSIRLSGEVQATPSILLMLSGVSGLHDILQLAEGYFKHPADIERLFSDPDFYPPFVFLVKEIKESKIIEAMEKDSISHRYYQKGESPSVLAITARNDLLRADIYLSSHLGKRETRNG